MFLHNLKSHKISDIKDINFYMVKASLGLFL